MKEKRHQRELAEVAEPQKDTKPVIQPIREETYQRLTAKPTLTGDLPIIYLPKLKSVASTAMYPGRLSESCQDLERRLLQMSLLSPGDELAELSQGDNIAPVTVKKKFVLRAAPKRRIRDMLMYMKNRRLIRADLG